MRAAIVAIALAIGAAGCAKLLGLDETYEIPECSVCESDTCVDLTSDPAHCGDCATACDADEACIDSECLPSAPCDTGTSEACYTGAAGTEDMGACHGGTRTCVDGHWGACDGEVTPSLDVCGNGVDEDCSGAPDNVVDMDGDGFTNCDFDCCDDGGQGCADPTAVNPGAYDFPDNGVDDDCDGTPDDPVLVCDSGLASNTGVAQDYARAMDLCQIADATLRNWGVVDIASQDTAGGGVTGQRPDPAQHSIRTAFGATSPQKAAAMAVIATGNAAATGQLDPPFVMFQSGTDFMEMATVPADWLAAHNNVVPTTPGCPAQTSGNIAHDPEMLALTIRVPTNAHSFRLSLDYMSSEFPEFVCSQYTDQFLILLGSSWAGTPANPPDGNLAFYDAGGTSVPVNCDLAHGNTGLFEVCKNGTTGCNTTPGTISSCVSDAELIGTGFDTADAGCSGLGNNDQVGGATGWLVARGNVVPGELITLRIAIWDASDGIYDSLALLDDFEWSPDTVTPGTTRD